MQDIRNKKMETQKNEQRKTNEFVRRETPPERPDGKVSANKIKSFKDLEIWKLGNKIAVYVYRVTKNFPPEEAFGLTAQMRRSAVAISSNIAEGFNRYHNQEYRQFLFVALGSCAELETFVTISLELQFVTQATQDSLLENLNHEARMISSLLKKINAGYVSARDASH
ncbi:MAG: four helix bundle protein [Candidatus Omnitrophota bacterium]